MDRSPDAGPDRPDLLGLDPDALSAALRAHFESRGQPEYRARQVARWIYEARAESFDDMTDLPAAERGALAEAFELREPRAESVARSADGTAKHLWRLADGELVESVLIPTPRRLTLCLSSQAGCAMGCTFCATGWTGFGRQLGAGEIVAQYRASQRWAEAHGYGRIGNVVYMGMGEPLANRRAVFASLEVLNRGYGLGARRITVSTVGVVPGILELAARPEQFRLALSLHAPLSELRARLIPLERRYPLPELMEALRRFDQAGGKRITFEYTMIAGVNDDPALIDPLAGLAAEVDAFVNLIPFNPIPWQPDWRPSPAKRLEQFRSGLERRGVSAAVREPRGRDIDAACGQLRANALVELDPSRPRARVAGESSD
ncbi:MAG: 23S rRNA (adenine(2503)-C(2))-methyltransferase RlmN [Gemmatimonadetes bacterium]|nr:MAG: 23S rRNA (adenine(2503)-C(2))-methyltransferase RlmN [Gemmatimonadota bacterium]